jgi:DNA repair protein RadA/Sms
VILVEIQALTGRSALSFPIRRTSGVDPERLPMILAVLEARAGCAASTHDVFVNVVGGMRLDEPAADLATSLAVASSILSRAVPRRTAVLGEVGLRGEVRRVAHVESRVRELEAIGVETVVAPRGNEEEARRAAKRLRVLGVADVASALLALSPAGRAS